MYAIGCLMLFMLCLDTVVLPAQVVTADTLHFSIREKTEVHPFFGMGSTYGYALNGVEGATMMIVRNKRYVWGVHEVPRLLPRPYVQPEGRGGGKYLDLFDDDDISNGWLYIKGEEEDPDTLYYGTNDSSFIGGMILVVDSLPTLSVDNPERPRSTLGVVAVTITPNPISTSATMTFSSRQSGPIRLDIVDLSGRLVRTQEFAASGNSGTSIPIDRKGLNAGTYVYRLTSVAAEEPIASGPLRIR